MEATAKRAVLATVAQAVPERKKVARLAASLAKNFKPTVAESLRRTNELAYMLYVHERPDLALQMCGLLNDIPFRNDYNLWTWVEATLALEWKLRTLAGETARAQACVDAIRATFDTGDESDTILLERRLGGSLFYNEKITEAEKENNTSLERVFRLVQLNELIFIQSLGGSEALPVPELERQIDFQLAKLRA